MGISLKWDLTGRCNLRCRHCLQGDRLREETVRPALTGTNRYELDEAAIISLIDKLPAQQIVHINFLGGEPTLLGEKFLSLVHHTSDRGIKTTFNTNGTTLTSDFIERMLASGAAGVIVSVDGPTAESHDAVRGAGTFVEITRNLRRLMRRLEEHERPFETTVSTVVTPYNGENLVEMVDYCLDLGVETLNLLPMSYTGYALANASDLFMSEEREVEIADKFVHDLSQRQPDGLRIEARFILPPLANYLEQKHGYALRLTKNCCSATTTFGYINPSGELFPCDRIAYDFEDEDFGAPDGRRASLVDLEFGEVWNSDFQKRMFRYVTDRTIYESYIPCNRCAYLDAGLCVPCPLFQLRNDTVSFHQCCFAERELGSLRLSPRHHQERTEGSHYLNQYQPQRRLVLAEDDASLRGRRLKRAQGVRWNTLPGREIVFNPRGNKFYSMNALGRQIWELLGEESTDVEIVQAVQESKESPGDRKATPDEVRHFLSALVAERLLELSEEPEHAR